MAFYPEDAPVPTYFSTHDYFIVPIHSYYDYIQLDNVFEYHQNYFRAYYSFDPDRMIDGDDYMEWRWRLEDHQKRKCFSFVVLENVTNQILGGITIGPVTNKTAEDFPDKFEAGVYFWLLKSKEEDLDRHLLITLKDWFKQEWPFSKVYFKFEYFNDRERQTQIFTEAGLQLKFTDERGNPVYGE